MRHPDDPARLADDPGAPAPLAEALRAARGTAPDPERLARLGVALGLPSAGAGAAACGAAAAATGGGGRERGRREAGAHGHRRRGRRRGGRRRRASASAARRRRWRRGRFPRSSRRSKRARPSRSRTSRLLIDEAVAPVPAARHRRAAATTRARHPPSRRRPRRPKRRRTLPRACARRPRSCNAPNACSTPIPPPPCASRTNAGVAFRPVRSIRKPRSSPSTRCCASAAAPTRRRARAPSKPLTPARCMPSHQAPDGKLKRAVDDPDRDGVEQLRSLIAAARAIHRRSARRSRASRRNARDAVSTGARGRSHPG